MGAAIPTLPRYAFATTLAVRAHELKLSFLSVVLLAVSLNTVFSVEVANERRVLQLIKNSEYSELSQLLDSGLDPNMRVPIADGTESLLIAACVFSNVRTVTVLLTHGASAAADSATGILGESPVAIAMNRGNADLIELLIQHGANPAGFTSLMIAIMRGNLIAAKAEIEHGADVNAMNKFRRSAFDFAHPIAECVQFLLQHGAKHSYSPVEIATMLGDEAAIRHELENPEVRRSLPAAVRWAIFYDRPAILDLIVTAVPGVASEEYEFRTPAAQAAEFSRLECLRVLVRRGADLNRPSEGDLTPKDLARRSNSTACLRFLEALGKK